MTTDIDKNIYQSVRTILEHARSNAYKAINFAMVEAYWEIGRQIEDAVGDRAEYGKGLLRYLSENLRQEFGKGFDQSNLRRMRQFYQIFPIRDTLCHELNNYLLKCFVIIDLKAGKLTYQDAGQIDFYVQYYDEYIRLSDDNPTIGIVLCAEKSSAVAKYSVLAKNEQLFASKYRLLLPSEEELSKEILREREEIERMLEAGTEDKD